MRAMFLSAVLMVVSACGTHHVEDSKSNWLRQCVVQQDCGTQGDCVCGVCTKACDSMAVCDALSGADALCVSLADVGLAQACQSDPMLNVGKVCLQPCDSTAQCGARQACLQGLCVSASLAPSMMMDAGATHDSGAPPGAVNPGPPTGVGGGGGNSSVVMPPPPNPPPTPTTGPDDDGGVPACGDCRNCGCNGGQLCGYTDQCVEPGVADANGVITLNDKITARSQLFAADANYVYGVDFNYTGTGGQLMRWPIRGGKGKAMAKGVVFNFGAVRAATGATAAASQPPLIADDSRLYFVATGDASELSNSLWSMPKNDSAAPTRHGTIGSLIAQDQDYLYFSNDGDSRVLRMTKTSLKDSFAPELVYTSASDAPLTILLLTDNTSSIYVTEVPPHATHSDVYTVESIDKASRTPTALASSDQFTTSALTSFADDKYFIMAGPEGTNRLDLSTHEVKPLGGAAYQTSFAAGYLYGSDSGVTSSSLITFWRIDVAAARFTNLVQLRSGGAVSCVAVPGSVFANVIADGQSAGVLVQLTSP